MTTVLDRKIEVPLTFDVDGALGEVAVDGSTVLMSMVCSTIGGSMGTGMGGRFTGL